MKKVNLAILTCLVIPQLLLSQPIKPLWEIAIENCYYKLKQAKTKEEKAKVRKECKKIYLIIE